MIAGARCGVRLRVARGGPKPLRFEREPRGGRDGDHARDPQGRHQSKHSNGCRRCAHGAGPTRRGRLVRPCQVYPLRH